MTDEAIALCHRCEYRALYKEEGHRPRYECGMDYAVCSCYMYRPVKPVLLERNAGDRRPLGGPAMFGARAHRAAHEGTDDEFELRSRVLPRRRGRATRLVMWWGPKNQEQE